MGRFYVANLRFILHRDACYKHFGIGWFNGNGYRIRIGDRAVFRRCDGNDRCPFFDTFNNARLADRQHRFIRGAPNCTLLRGIGRCIDNV